MQSVKIGLIREGKKPIDGRVALCPDQAALLQKMYPHLKVMCQSSEIRCFSDEEYADRGIEVVNNVNHCDVLLGIKEVPIEELFPEKTYLFFSHTVKKQSYNRDLLKEILNKRIRLIDYECLRNVREERIVGFGRYAGIVGAYNGILTFGLKHRLFQLKRAKDCRDYHELKEEYKKVMLPPIKILLTGSGRVAGGVIEVMEGMGIKKVWPRNILQNNFDVPVYAQLFTRDHHYHREGAKFNIKEFYDRPHLYYTDFHKYLSHIDILIAGAYWDPRGPALFTVEDMKNDEFRLDLIADITCDIEGSIPSTKRAATIDEPIYDYNPFMDQEEDPFSGERNVTVMAVDNLPTELPRDASCEFGQTLISSVLPYLLINDEFGIIEKATIAADGHLTKHFGYLRDFVSNE